MGSVRLRVEVAGEITEELGASAGIARARAARAAVRAREGSILMIVRRVLLEVRAGMGLSDVVSRGLPVRAMMRRSGERIGNIQGRKRTGDANRGSGYI